RTRMIAGNMLRKRQSYFTCPRMPSRRPPWPTDTGSNRHQGPCCRVRVPPLVRYFRRRWEEDPGFEHAGWGSSEGLVGSDDDGNVTRQSESFEIGRVLEYDESHVEDDYGGLSEKPLDFGAFGPFEITAEEFSRAVDGLRPFNR